MKREEGRGKREEGRGKREEEGENMEWRSPWIYLAGPLFTRGEVEFNADLAQRLRAGGYCVYLPQQACAGLTEPEALFGRCMEGLAGAGMVIVILDGTDADSGSCFEMGYAYARQLPIIGVRTDFRGSGEHLGLNLMLTHSCTHLLLTTVQKPAVSPPNVTYLSMGDHPEPALLAVLEMLPAAQACRHSLGT
jgi:hypothetical protein